MSGTVTLEIDGRDSDPNLQFYIRSDTKTTVSTYTGGRDLKWVLAEMDLYSLRMFCDEAIRRIDDKRAN